MSCANLEPRETIKRSLKNEVREEHGGFQRISNSVAQTTLSLQSRVLRRARCSLWMHEQQHSELLRLSPERIELAVGELLAFDASSDGGATQSQLSDRFVQLIRRQIRVLQRNGGHSYKSIRMLSTPLRKFFILELDNVSSQRAVRRVPPCVDVDRLIVDALGVHIDQSLRVAERDVAGEVVLRSCSQRCVLDQVPDLRHETVGVSIHG